MDLKIDYEKLYQQWLEEFNQTNLTELNQELFSYYKNNLVLIREYKEENPNEIKESLLRIYKDNFNFLFNDLLKLREEKIIKSALSLKEIDLQKVIETEKLLYQNLVSAIKGFKKLKSHSLLEGVEEKNFEALIESEIKKKIDTIEQSISNDKEDTTISTSSKIIDKERIEYILVRFLKKTPPLVGIDLINYGPFEKEDIANLPRQNAEILLSENFVEKIEIP
ncbi:MAG: hypothetical protein ACFFC3_12010 [Candidatus Odinarchaeota archaeon]